MSSIYNTITNLTKNITKNIKNSLLFTIIFKLVQIIEKQWNESFLKKYYPNENFLSFFNKSKILKNYLFHPLIVIVIFTIFLLLSYSGISWSLELNLIIAFLSFFIGATIFPKYLLNNKNIETIKFKKDDIYSIGFCITLVGIIFFILCIASVGGIPLIKSNLRYSLSPALTMPVFLIIPGIGLLASSYLYKYNKNEITRSQTRFRFLTLFLLSAIILLGLAYRTPLLAALLMLIILGYYGKILSIGEVMSATILGIITIIGIGYYRVIEEGTLTKGVGPLSTLQSRADFTLHVLDLLNSVSGDYGIMHGRLLASSLPGSSLGPRMTVGKLIAWRSEVTVTPTLLGQMIIDFGRIGVAVEMGLLGFILGIGFKIIKKTKENTYIFLYAILLTYTILGIETGILDIQVLVYFIVGIFVYLITLFKNKNRAKHENNCLLQ